MAAVTLCKTHYISSISCLSRLFVSSSHIQKNTVYVSNKLWTKEKPKKPLNPFFQYVGMVYEDVAAKQPEMRAPDIMKIIAQNYKSLSEEQLEAMRLDFNEKLAEYRSELEDWEDSLSPEEKEALADQAMQKRANKKAVKQKKMSKKLAEEFEKPKRPASAFMLFSVDLGKDSSLSVTELAKKKGDAWSKLADKKKKVYEDKANKMMEVYQEELYNWELKMIEMDQESLVRKSTLKKLNQSGDILVE